MRKELHIVPSGWPCRFSVCPPGFFLFNDALCIKSEYGEAFCETGEAFWGGAKTRAERSDVIVQPVVYVWKEVAA